MSKVTYLLGAGASYGTRGVLPLDQQPFVSSDASPAERGILRGLLILQSQIVGEYVMTTLSHSEKEHIMADIPFCDKTRISVEGVKIWG